MTVGFSALIANYYYLFRHQVRIFLFGILFLLFLTQLTIEKWNWTSNLQIIKKAMEVTPGNIALNTYYLQNLRKMAHQEGGSEELKSVIETVETSLVRQCLPKTKDDSLGTISLCQIFFSTGHWPQKGTALPLTPKENKLALLDWEAKARARRLNMSFESAKEEQWSLRLLLLDEIQPPPKKRPFLTTEGERKDYLAALHKWDPKSDEYLKLQKKWEALGVLGAGFDVTKHKRSFQ